MKLLGSWKQGLGERFQEALGKGGSRGRKEENEGVTHKRMHLKRTTVVRVQSGVGTKENSKISWKEGADP